MLISKIRRTIILFLLEIKVFFRQGFTVSNCNVDVNLQVIKFSPPKNQFLNLIQYRLFHLISIESN